MHRPVLSVTDLHLRTIEHTLVQKVHFTLNAGQTLALVGESGSGKSLTALSIARLLPEGVHHQSGQIKFDGIDIATLSDTQLRQLRGAQIGFIFQEPMTSLNPLHSIEKQIGEVLALHWGLIGKARQQRILELLDQVEIDKAKQRLSALPHELSGGQRQRVMIAMAIACRPKLLIADEPTTALDVTIQADILRLLQQLQQAHNMAMLFISHDLNVVQRLAHQVAVMQQGKIIEQASCHTVFNQPTHSYTRTLLQSQPSGEPVTLPLQREPLLHLNHLSVALGRRRLFSANMDTKILSSITLRLGMGETIGLVGESGSGKTTLGLAILKLIISKGEINYKQHRVDLLSSAQMRPLRAQMQMVFQDPYGSLSPRQTVAQIIGEGLEVHHRHQTRAEKDQHIAEVMHEVGLDPSMASRYPHAFSGGQRQRISLARALILSPQLLILDEPTSALDITLQAQMITLLKQLQQKRGLSYLFISHDLRVIRAIAHQIIVLKQGQIIEQGDAKTIFTSPTHPYTQQLLSAAFLDTGNLEKHQNQ